MKFLTFLLFFIPTSTFACWAPCPEGKECYFEEVWSSAEELAEMAGNTHGGKCTAETELYDMMISTGAAYHYSCVDGKVHVQQTAANKRMRIKGGEEGLAEEENPEFGEIASQCEVGKGQQACLDAHAQLVEAAALRMNR